MGMKKCSKCGVEKEGEEFGFQGKGRRLRAQCRTCHSITNREWHRRNHPRPAQNNLHKGLCAANAGSRQSVAVEGLQQILVCAWLVGSTKDARSEMANVRSAAPTRFIGGRSAWIVVFQFCATI